MGVVYNTAGIVTDGLVLALDAANPKSYPGSGTTWTDLSGNGNNGTLVNGPTFDSANKGSIVFDGTNDRTDIANSSTINITGSNITLCALVNPSLFKQAMAFVHKNFQYTIAFYGNASSGTITYADSSNWSYANFGQHGNFLPNKWYYIVATKNSSNIVTIYANNTVIISKSFGSSITSTGNLLNVGNYSTNYYFDGKISHCKIYNKTLTASEINQNFNALRGRYGI
jgi:hypothetical protein